MFPWILLARRFDHHLDRFDHAVTVAQSFAVAVRASRDLLNGGQRVRRIQSDGGHASILKDETDSTDAEKVPDRPD